MAVERVLKIRFTGLSSSRPALLAAVESLGCVQPADTPEVPDWLERSGIDAGDVPARLADLDWVISFLEEATGDRRKPPPAVRMTPEELSRVLDDENLMWTARRAWRVAMVLSERHGDLGSAREEERRLLQWEDLPVRVEDLGRGPSWTALAGIVPAAGLPAVEAAAAGDPLTHLLRLGPAEGGERILVVAHSSSSGAVAQILSEAGFSLAEFPSSHGHPRDLLRRVRARMARLSGRIGELEGEARSLALSLPDLKALRDAVGQHLERLGAAGATLSGERIFVLHGWVRESDLPKLSAAVSRLEAVDLQPVEPLEGEEPPVALSESPVLDPYVMLTDMFGSPAPADPDPTPLMAPFFSLFLGVCIGDAGYGAVLALATGIMLLAARRDGRRSRLLPILLHGGIAAVGVGILLGAWFGMDRALLPGFLTAPAGLLDSLVPGGGQFGVSKQFLYVAMALGVLQLLFGIIVNLRKRWRAGERLVAVVEQGAWTLALLGMFPWLFNHYLVGGVLYDVEGPLDSVFLGMLAAGAALIFVTGGREAKGFGRIGLGGMAVYGIVNLLADALSYARLFALSLSGGIIASVVNQIAGMLPGTDIPVLGTVISVVVIVFGHLFNISMGVLGGFIHTARLQFVEFFGKFYEGTGSPFVPLRYDPVHIRIRRETE